MFRSIQPLQFLLILLAGWINRQQLDVIDYLKEENRLLKERLGGRRIRLTDVERRRLAHRAHVLGRKALGELDTLVTPDTLLRWYRTLVALKWTYTHRRGPGRPRTVNTIVQLIVRMALENRSWGYTRIQGALENLGHHVARGTIANVLRENGIDPAPERGKCTAWSTFLKAHWEGIAATDFITVEVVTLRGLVTHYVLFFLDLASRAVKIAGITPNPREKWMLQIVRNLTDLDEPFLQRARFLIMDRDTKYSATFRAALTRERISPIRLSDADGDALAYSWSMVSRPSGSTATLSSASAVRPTFTTDREGTYSVRLVVNDGHVDSAAATVQVSTINSAPVTNSGADQTAAISAHVALDGSVSSDVDGDSLTYVWSIVSRPAGSTAMLITTDPSNPNAEIVIDRPGSYVVRLIVNDGTVNSAPDEMTISTLNSRPVANAGTDQSEPVGTTIALNGGASTDADGDALTYRWSLTTPTGSQAALTTTTGVATEFVIDRTGTYVAQLIVNDGRLDSVADTVVISTVNSRPVANAGADQSGNVGSTITLNGGGSTDADGDALAFDWALIAAPAQSVAGIENANTRSPSFVPDYPGTYIVQLIVSDGQLDSSPASLRVIVEAAQGNPPQITVTNPMNGQHVNSTTISLEGYLDRAASLTANGSQISLYDETHFSYAMQLNDGINELTLVAEDAEGRSVVLWQITLDRIAPSVPTFASIRVEQGEDAELVVTGAAGGS